MNIVMMGVQGSGKGTQSKLLAERLKLPHISTGDLFREHAAAGTELGRRALVLWHGTSAARAQRIRRVGLFPRKGVWATADPELTHSFCRGRADRHGAGSAVIVLLFDREDIPVAFEPARERDTLRFRSVLPPECIEYVLWEEWLEFVGSRCSRRPRQWGVCRFKKRHGRWVPRSRPPVRCQSSRDEVKTFFTSLVVVRAAETRTNRASQRAAMMRPKVVFPVPGGPQKMRAENPPRSISALKGPWGPKRCRWPTTSERSLGRSLSASGASPCHRPFTSPPGRQWPQRVLPQALAHRPKAHVPSRHQGVGGPVFEGFF